MRDRAADRLEHGPVAVDQRDRRVDDRAGGDAGARHDQRNGNELLVHHRLAPQSPAAEIVAVVGRVDHPGRARQPRRLEGREDLADIVVEEADEGIVGGDRAPDRQLVGEEVVVVHDRPERPDGRVPRVPRPRRRAGASACAPADRAHRTRAVRSAESAAARARRTAPTASRSRARPSVAIHRQAAAVMARS